MTVRMLLVIAYPALFVLQSAPDASGIAFDSRLDQDSCSRHSFGKRADFHANVTASRNDPGIRDLSQ